MRARACVCVCEREGESERETERVRSCYQHPFPLSGSSDHPPSLYALAALADSADSFDTVRLNKEHGHPAAYRHTQLKGDVMAMCAVMVIR